MGDLQPKELKVGTTIELKNIFYDYNESYVREDAKLELEKLIKLMKQFPSLKLELGAHTDSRGGKKYNQSLSQNRANSVVEYITDRGINKSRIIAIGYGENVLRNYCSDGIECPEEAPERSEPWQARPR